MTQTIYFDETGFTGSNLLSPSQPLFCYGSIATDKQEAESFAQRITKDFRIQGDEIKGSKLVKFSRGRKAIDELLAHFNGRIRISLHDKKYALAGKIFEYSFEPALAENNKIFYDLGFHKFIANLLHLSFVSADRDAEEIFHFLEETFRLSDQNQLTAAIESETFPNQMEESHPLFLIAEFMRLNAQVIKDELSSPYPDPRDKWRLDLTSSSLFSLLAEWGTKYDPIMAICDDSKPLIQDQDFFSAMVDRTDRSYIHMGGEEHPITFNLAEPIRLGDSKSTPGIQLADAVAAAGLYAFSGDDATASKWKNLFISNGLVVGSVLPIPGDFNPASIETQLNSLLLVELVARSREGLSLTEGIGEFLTINLQLLRRLESGDTPQTLRLT